MKIGNFDLVSQAMMVRRALVAKRDTGKFGVTISGTYQDDEIVEAARPAIVAILNQRIMEIDMDLRALGVVIDDIG